LILELLKRHEIGAVKTIKFQRSLSVTTYAMRLVTLPKNIPGSLPDEIW